MHVAHDEARDTFLAQLDAFVAAVHDLGDRHLLAPSRCVGWTVGDLIVHVHMALQEMLLGLVTPTDDPVDSDAAQYWRAGPPGDDDELDGLRFVQRLGAAYRRPTGAVTHLLPTVAGVRTAVAALRPGRVRFQGQVLDTGDFLATWAVELAVHHLDLNRDDPPVPAAVRLARLTIEALVDGAFPADWTDETVTLLGTGRVRPDRAHLAASPLAVELPVLT